MRKRKKVIAALLAVSMTAGLWSVPGVEVLNVQAAAASAISSEELCSREWITDRESAGGGRGVPWMKRSSRQR